MNGPPDRHSAQPSPSPQSITAPLLLWLVLQLLALLLSAGRVPLAANWARPGETWAIQTMIVAQIAGSGMLFPLLLRDRASAIACILTAGPMLQLAGFLSNTAVGTIAMTWACLGAWLAALSMLRAALPARWHLAAVAMLNLVTLGGPLSASLADQQADGIEWVRYLPLYSLTSFATGNADGWVPLLSTAAFLAVAAGVRWASGRKWKADHTFV